MDQCIFWSAQLSKFPVFVAAEEVAAQSSDRALCVSRLAIREPETMVSFSHIMLLETRIRYFLEAHVPLNKTQYTMSALATIHP